MPFQDKEVPARFQELTAEFFSSGFQVNRKRTLFVVHHLLFLSNAPASSFLMNQNYWSFKNNLSFTETAFTDGIHTIEGLES